MRKLGIVICLGVLLLLIGVCLSFAAAPDEGDLGLAVVPSGSSVQISWNPPPYVLPEHPIHPELTFDSDQVQCYIIERSTSDYPTMFYRLAEVPANVYSYVDNSVETGKKYGYCVTASISKNSVSKNVYGIDHIYQRSPLITIPTQSQPTTIKSESTASKEQQETETLQQPQQNEPQTDKDIALLTIGSTDLFVNGQKIKLDVAPKIENGRTLVPLRAISEALGAEVKWNEETQTIIITKDK